MERRIIAEGSRGEFKAARSGIRVPRQAAGQAIIYELHIGTFTAAGTYAAAREKLPHLVELGVTHLELMPVATFPGRRGWGYDGVDLFAPFPAYGTPQELVAFVDDCHAHGLAVLLDVVYNHLGPDGNYLGHSRPTSPIATRPGGARRSITTARTATGCAGLSSTMP